jgi:poly(glycerol-phosphate) alpha-glucosyltransferase
MASPDLPAPVRHFTLTWRLEVDHGGMTSALLRRSRMFAAGFGTTVTILTFDREGDYDAIRAGLRARGLLPDGVEVLNLWEWLAARPGVARVTDEHDAPVRGGRRVRVLDADGAVLREWRTAWALYTHWLDALRDGGRAVMIADSKPVARFLATYRRRDVVTAHVVHGSQLAAIGRGISAARRPALERIDDFDLIALLTRQQRADLERRLGRRPNVRVIPNAVGAVAGPLAAPDRRGGVVLASLVPRKRVDHAIAAFAAAGARDGLDVYGDGPSRPAVERRAAETDGVRLHGFQPEASAILRERSYLLLTSTSEGSPLCVLEALAAGCLPIAYDVPFGPGDVIRDGVNGFLVPSGDVAAMASRIARLDGLPAAEVARMRRRAVATAAAYAEQAVLARWERELRAAWHRKTGVLPRARRVLRRRFATAA